MEGLPASPIRSLALLPEPPADPPEALDDHYRADTGQSISIAAPGVLANDITYDGALTAVLVSNATSGSLSFNPDGSFGYTPPTTNFHGTATFTYNAVDGSVTGSVPATVTLVIGAMTYDEWAAANGLSGADADPDADPDDGPPA